MKLFQKMNNCKKSALHLINKAFVVVASIFLGINIPLKTCAMPAPVIPEGLTPQVIEGTPGVQYDQSNLYLTLLYSLGLELSQFPTTQGEGVLRDGLTQEDCEAICEAFNEMNPEDPNLGDDLRHYMQITSLTYSQNGQVKEFELPRPLWVRLNKATKNGLKIKVESEPVNMTAYDFWVTYCDTNALDLNTVISRFETPFVIYEGYYANSYYIRLCMMGCTSQTYNSEYLKSDSPTATEHGFFTSSPTFGDLSNAKFNGSDINYSYLDVNNLRYFWARSTDLSNFIQYGAPSVINKNVGVARPFIQNKSTESYDVINKSSEIDPNTGKITGPVTMAVLSPAQLQQLQQMINEGLISLSEAMMKLGLSPYDDQTGLLIDSSLSPAQAQLAVANAVDPAPTEPHLASAFENIDEWNPQSVTPELPLAGVMNWVAVQMNILMNLSQFQNVWLVISTLAVAVLLIGMVRIWKG